MDDITARIIVTAEAAGAKQTIKGVENGISSVTDARLRDLQITQSKAKLELAEYNSLIAAQKAYNAEIQLEGAKKRLIFRTNNGAKKKEIEELSAVVEKLAGKYLSLANAEAAANLQAYQAKISHDNLAESFDNVGKSADGSQKKISSLSIAARVLGRVFKTDLGGGTQNFNANMFKAGIIAAGFASTIKLVKLGVDAYHNSLRKEVDIRSSNTQAMKEAWSNYKNLRDGYDDALNALDEYSDRVHHSADDQIKFSKAIKMLSVEFKQLGVNVDTSASKMSDFSEISAKIKQKEIDKEIRALESQRKGNLSTLEALQEQRDKSGFGFGDLRIGGEKEIIEASKEIERIGKENTDINLRLYALRKMTPEKDAEEKKRIQMEYSNKKINERLSKLKKEIEIQNLLAIGKEREVEILKIRNKLDEERSRLSAAEVKIFDKRRRELEIGMLASYDNRKKIESEKKEKLANEKRLKLGKDIDSQIEQYKEDIEINKMLASGNKREAEILKIRNKLDEEREKLSKEEKKVFDQRRNELESIMLAHYDSTVDNKEGISGWGDLAREFAKIRKTSQSAVLANSLEGMRMQSRMLLSPEMGDPQKRSAKSLETLTNQGKEMLNKMDSALAALTGVKSNTAAFAGISGTKRF